MPETNVRLGKRACLYGGPLTSLSLSSEAAIVTVAHDIGSLCMKIDDTGIIISVVNDVRQKSRQFPTKGATDKLMYFSYMRAEPQSCD